MRAGAHVLLLATDPVNRGILRTVLDRPLAMHGGLYRVSAGGREVLFVAFAAERWLQSAPQGPIDFEGDEGERTIAALAEGWSAAVVHALVRGAKGFDELSGAIGGIRRRELRRHLSALQRTGLVEVLPDPREGGGAVYVATDWLRAGLAPLVAAGRVEREQHVELAAPIDALDVEAAFHMALPLLELPRELSGVCRLGVNLEHEGRPGLTGVTAEIDSGRVVACRPGLRERADAWAAGTAGDWLDTVIEPDGEGVRTGGDRWLTEALVTTLHRTLFGVSVA